ncbi:MAG: YabP/YqfC family sporulation protein [Lachnospiraceae bacterium]|nr:YabP/YqfC family sporulation protein [Lachnospiraceae bacterium]MDD6182281.1 YabP/YqfC family sporulation protein [Lachnospiraceae bacterium]MDD7377837.1 YabP/YqfC family sporulation protein [Lachnospiraceae bacterium]MDY5775859.1 YabP/YqfC family sporulation protein [Lachnospiraceae bacterium]
MGKTKLKSVKENMVETLELPKDLMYGASIVTITGRREVLIENYKGILEYTEEYIKIQTKNAKLTVYGKRLNIEYYTNEDMKVVGFIKSIEFEA